MPNILTAGSQYRSVKTGNIVIPFNSGNVSAVELPRTLFKKRVTLRLSGTVSVTVAGSGVVAEAPGRLIRKIEIVGDGVKTYVSQTGLDLFRLAHILEGKQPQLVGPAGAGVQTNTAINMTIPVHFEATRMRSPVDSYMDPRGFESVQLRITWGTIADIITGGTATVNAGTQIEAISHDTAIGEENIAYRRLLLYDENPITGASTQLPFNIPRNGLLAGILFHADVNLSPSDALINFISLKSDNVNVHVDRIGYETLRQNNVVEYQIDSTTFGNGVNGYVYLDLTEDGMISSALNTYNFNTFQVLYDINFPGATQFVRQCYIFYEPINVG